MCLLMSLESLHLSNFCYLFWFCSSLDATSIQKGNHLLKSPKCVWPTPYTHTHTSLRKKLKDKRFLLVLLEPKITPGLRKAKIIHITAEKVEKSAPTVSLFLVNNFFPAKILYFHPTFICIAKQHPVPPVLFLVLHVLSQTPTKLHPTY